MLREAVINLLGGIITTVFVVNYFGDELSGKFRNAVSICDLSPSDIAGKLFQPFFTTKTVGEGIGLGLSITKGILHQHKATTELRRDLPQTWLEIRFASCR